MKIEGKAAIVTGSGRGLGKAYAEALLQKGANVCITDILVKEAEETTREFRQKYGRDRVIFVRCNVTNRKEFKNVFDETIKKFGGVHILVNNAGILDRPDFETTLAINLEALIFGTFTAVEHMHKEKGGEGGVIVNISSIIGMDVLPGCPVYQATKHGVLGFSRAYALTLGEDVSQHGVRVNVLCPAYIRTEVTQKLDDARKVRPAVDEAFQREGGWTPPEVIAEGMIRLVEDDNLHGGVLRVNRLRQTLVYPEHLREQYNS